jgi:hypothetical protein
MKTNRFLPYSELSFLQSILVYIILAIILFPHFQYQLNPDGISYMSIAQKYQLHDYSNAINGYWGPLISWLMVPFLKIGLKPQIAAVLLLLIIGLTVVIQSYSIIIKLNINILLKNTASGLISIIVIYFAFHTITPDLLFVSFSLAFINKIFDQSFSNFKYSGVWMGLIGSALYLTKSFGFPFFIATFFTVSLIFYLRTDNINDRSRIISNYILGMIIFIIISGFWISLISHKYGHFLIGTSGAYNRALTEPKSLGHPMFYAGLLDPPNSTATSIWEDVSFLKIKSWNIFDSTNTMIYEIRIICKNIIAILSILIDFSLLAIPVFLVALGYLLKIRKQVFSDKIFYLVLFLIIMFSGYAMIAVDPRYIWLSNIILIIMGAKLLNLLFDKVPLRKIIKLGIIGIYLFSFLVLPLKSIYRSLDEGKNLYELSNRLNKLDINGRIASIGDWERSYYISFHNGWQYYGRSGNLNESDLENELKNKMIDYYFVWESDNNNLNFLNKYKEITGGNINGLKIYRLK